MGSIKFFPSLNGSMLQKRDFTAVETLQDGLYEGSHDNDWFFLIHENKPVKTKLDVYRWGNSMGRMEIIDGSKELL